MKKFYKINNKGFTLIEVVITLSVLSILFSFGYISFIKKRHMEIFNKIATEIAMIQTAEKEFYLTNKTFKASVADLKTANLLPANFPEKNPFGYDYNITIIDNGTASPKFKIETKVTPDGAKYLASIFPVTTAVGDTFSTTEGIPGSEPAMNAVLHRFGDDILRTMEDDIIMKTGKVIKDESDNSYKIDLTNNSKLNSLTLQPKNTDKQVILIKNKGGDNFFIIDTSINKIQLGKNNSYNITIDDNKISLNKNLTELVSINDTIINLNRPTQINNNLTVVTDLTSGGIIVKDNASIGAKINKNIYLQGKITLLTDNSSGTFLDLGDNSFSITKETNDILFSTTKNSFQFNKDIKMKTNTLAILANYFYGMDDSQPVVFGTNTVNITVNKNTNTISFETNNANTVKEMTLTSDALNFQGISYLNILSDNDTASLHIKTKDQAFTIFGDTNPDNSYIDMKDYNKIFIKNLWDNTSVGASVGRFYGDLKTGVMQQAVIVKNNTAIGKPNCPTGTKPFILVAPTGFIPGASGRPIMAVESYAIEYANYWQVQAKIINDEGVEFTGNDDAILLVIVKCVPNT